MFKHWTFRASLAVGLSVLLVSTVLGLGEPRQLWSVLSNVSGFAIVGWVCVYGVLVYLRAARFRVLLPQCGLFTLIRAIGVQGGINRIVPFRLGELSLPLLIRQREDLPGSSVLFALAWIRLLELSLICVSITLGVVLHGLAGRPPLMQEVALGVALTVLSIFVAVDPRRIAYGITIGLQKHIAVLSRIHSKVGVWASALIREVEALPPLSVTERFKLLGWSLAVHCCILSLYLSMLDVFGASVSMGALLIGVGASQVTSLMPMLTVGTIGLHELGWVGGFVYCGLSTEMAVTSGVLTQAFTLLLGVVWAGGLYLSSRHEGGITA